jgi:hypothetical protein
MIQLNLLPDLKKEFVKAQQNKALVISVSIIITIASLGISALLFVYVSYGQQLQIDAISGDINNKTRDLKGIPNLEKYLTIQNQLMALPQLHNDKGQYSRLFDFLVVMNPKAPNNVVLNNLQVDSVNKSISLVGATTSYESLNVFVDTLKNVQVSYKVQGQGDPVKEKMFDSVSLVSSSLSKEGVNNMKASFSIQVVYKDAIFAVQNTEVKAAVPSMTTTQSVTEAPQPGQLFDTKTNTGGK